MAEGRPGLGARVKAAVAELRERAPVLDHVIRMLQHYSAANGSIKAGGVTYFAFLSFFPLLALAFFVVGYVARIWPAAEDNLVLGIQQVLPGLVGTGSGQISLGAIRDNAGTAGLIGLAGVLYAGLGWLSALRNALLSMFDRPADARPNFLVGKARDLVTLAVLGLVMLLSVSVSTLVSGFSEQVLGWLGLTTGSSWLLLLLSLLIGVASSTLLFFGLFMLLARPRLPRRSVLSGALLGGVAFEALKWASSYLLRATREQPAAQAFGIALVLLVWMYYFSRVVMYAAAWAYTTTAARAERAERLSGESADSRALRERVEAARAGVLPTGPAPGPPRSARVRAALTTYAVGAASGVAAIAWWRHRVVAGRGGGDAEPGQ